MDKTLLSVLFMMLYTMSWTQDTVSVKSDIKAVTVFFSGADVTREGNINLNKGSYLLALNKLPLELDPSSIKVKPVNGLTILSVKLNEQTSEKENFLKIQAHEKKIDQLEAQAEAIQLEKQVLESERTMLHNNSVFYSQQQGASVATIREASTYYRERETAINKGLLAKKAELKKLKETIEKSYRELNASLAADRNVYTQVEVLVACKQPVKGTLSASYYIPSAGWEPLYDFRVKDTDNPLNIDYNANLYQSSGEDWKNVMLKLASTNPKQDNTKPELSPWYFGAHTQPAQKDANINLAGAGSLRGKVRDKETGEPLPFVNIVLEQNGTQISGTSTDFEGVYYLKPIPPGTYDVKVSFVGYTAQKRTGVTVKSDKITFLDIELSSGISLESVEVIKYSVPLVDRDGGSSGATMTMPGRSYGSVVSRVGGVSRNRTSIRGARSDGGNFYYVDGVKHRGSVNQDAVFTANIKNSVNTSGTSTLYSIDVPYTIPSNGNDNLIHIKSARIPVKYQYHCVPKLETDVFLSARLTDWSKLNLLSGEASIYYQGIYTGKSYIDMTIATDTMELSLGRDNNVFVKREGNNTLYDKKIMGSNIKEVFGWSITVRNNRQSAVPIIIQDQIPISDRKSVEIELLTQENAKYEKEQGLLTWNLEVAPGKAEKMEYSYSIKYPR